MEASESHSNVPHPTQTNTSIIERPKKETLPKHLKKFASHISTNWTDYEEDIDQYTATNVDVNNRIVWAYDYYVVEEKKGEALLRMFCEDFAYWSFETWETATAKVRQEMRDLLEEKGIPTAKGSGLSVSRDLKAIISDFINAKSIDIKSR
ncbi:hypothetical protein E4U39_006448 [Claviceps sp. Clav50 group G5]|nr:hypothetical protein E4U39_006448 [Claviceps sp. Clav50 group G5]